MYLYASLTFVLLFAERTVPNTQPPLISTLVLQNDLLLLAQIQVAYQTLKSSGSTVFSDGCMFRRWKDFIVSSL